MNIIYQQHIDFYTEDQELAVGWVGFGLVLS